MADVSDVTRSLAQLVNGALYPDNAPTSQASPTSGLVVLTLEGWPTKQSLDAYVKAGKAQVSVRHFNTAGNTTRGLGDEEFEMVELKSATFSLAKIGQNVTVAGAAPDPHHPQNIVVFVDGQAFVHQTTPGQTAAQVAAALSALIPGSSATLNVITIPSPALIGALRVGVTGTAIAEVRRQREIFMVSVWAPTPETRDAIATVVDLTLARITNMGLQDGGTGLLCFVSTMVNDFDQLENIYRRDLNYSVEYATTVSETETQITVIDQSLEGPNGEDLAQVEY